MFQAQEMSFGYVEDNVIDHLGITGYDWVIENGSDVHEVCELIVFQGDQQPGQMGAGRARGIEHHQTRATGGRHYFHRTGQHHRRLFQEDQRPDPQGRIQLKRDRKSSARLVDAIVDVTETRPASSLRGNKLRVIDTLLTSMTRL